MKTSILHQFTELKASVVGISSGIGYPAVGTVSVVKINWYNAISHILGYLFSLQIVFILTKMEV